MLAKQTHAFLYILAMNIFAQAVRFICSSLPAPSEKRLHTLSSRRRKADSFFQRIPSQLEKARHFLSIQQYEKALVLCAAITDMDPKHHWAWHAQGDAYQLMKRYAKSEISYRKACSLQPKIALHWGGLANSLYGQGKVREADMVWRNALRLDPSLIWMRPN